MGGPLDIFRDVITRLIQEGIEYYLVGSLASMYYGRPRFTHDVDLVVKVRTEHIAAFERLFNIEDYYCPPVEVITDEVIRRGSFNLIHQETGIKVGIIISKNTLFAESEFARRKKKKLLPNFEGFVATPEDIIINKLEFYREGGSEKHITDIRGILANTEVDRPYLDKWINELGLLTQWEKAQ